MRKLSSKKPKKDSISNIKYKKLLALSGQSLASKDKANRVHSLIKKEKRNLHPQTFLQCILPKKGDLQQGIELPLIDNQHLDYVLNRYERSPHTNKNPVSLLFAKPNVVNQELVA